MQKSNLIFGTKFEVSPVTSPFQDSYKKSHTYNAMVEWRQFYLEMVSKGGEIMKFSLNIQRINACGGVKLSERGHNVVKFRNVLLC